MTRIHELIVYRNFENGQILEDMAWIFDHAGSEYYNEEDLRGLYYECIHGLVDLAGTYGFEGNLWHTYLTYLLVNNENAFSTASEIRGESLPTMILRFSRSFMILISGLWKKLSRLPATP